MWNGSSDSGGSNVTYVISINGVDRTEFNTTSTSKDITGLENGQQYIFKVKAKNLTGSSNYSKSTAEKPRTTPGRPENVEVMLVIKK